MRKTGFKADIVALILERDGGCARCGQGTRGQRGVDYDIHHRRPRGMGGSKEAFVNYPSNGVTLCRSCHDHVEANRSESIVTGWLVSRIGIDRPSAVPVWHARYGFVRLLDDGTTETA